MEWTLCGTLKGSNEYQNVGCHQTRRDFGELSSIHHAEAETNFPSAPHQSRTGTTPQGYKTSWLRSEQGKPIDLVTGFDIYGAFQTDGLIKEPSGTPCSQSMVLSSVVSGHNEHEVRTCGTQGPSRRLHGLADSATEFFFSSSRLMSSSTLWEHWMRHTGTL